MSTIEAVSRGAARTFDLFGSCYFLKRKRVFRHDSTDDTKAMASDWAAVGGDMDYAVERLRREVDSGGVSRY